jgi:hypothetical protein
VPIIRKFAIQGHAVPSGPTSPRGPFPPEVLAQNPRAYEPQAADSLHVALDDVRMFQCKMCGEILYEDELNNHDCESEK